jgi:hypothetical protein
MIPLLVLALMLGTGLALYEISPKARAWVDVHVAALQQHQTADAYLVAAKEALLRGEVWTSLQQVASAIGANQAAAQHTVTATETAQTAAQRVTAATSAMAVTARQGQIAEALALLGVGQCGVRTYAHVTPALQAALRRRLEQAGMSVTGENPWDIDTRTMGVKLRAVWDPAARGLTVIVTSGQGGLFGLVTCDAIWAKIEPIMKELGA